jgi:hypothetical protein
VFARDLSRTVTVQRESESHQSAQPGAATILEREGTRTHTPAAECSEIVADASRARRRRGSGNTPAPSSNVLTRPDRLSVSLGSRASPCRPPLV